MNREQTLILKAQAGETGAFDELVTIYLPQVYRYLWWLVRDEATAQDLTQETFVRGWKSLHKIDPNRPWRAWLLRIARNCAYDYFRKKSTVPFSRLMETEDYQINQAVDEADLPDEQAEKNELAQQTRVILDELPTKYREVLMMHYLDDLSVSEIAQALNVSGETIRTQLRRGRLLFKKAWQTNLGHDINTVRPLNLAPGLGIVD